MIPLSHIDPGLVWLLGAFVTAGATHVASDGRGISGDRGIDVVLFIVWPITTACMVAWTIGRLIGYGLRAAAERIRGAGE